ncbi:hypothetical protein M407DRAFT_241853 [Tulasnella calospora MUT 4182]|uniref:Uncharacterized protein n=1 Tax=Tulasnella calospora MUT 4182 TaxID=1051891 RepID=A0A0C3MC80_9AGAM|nr:hypothetical protein M407DRAFT_241853 [Tulasnella calospora MUT 4182]
MMVPGAKNRTENDRENDDDQEQNAAAPLGPQRNDPFLSLRAVTIITSFQLRRSCRILISIC